MISTTGTGRSRVAAAALACGAATLVAVTGCASGSGSSATDTSSTAPASSAPSWASALGSGVTVVAPASPAPGNDSPGAVMAGFVESLHSQKFTQLCAYVPPSTQSKCKSIFSSASTGMIASQMPTFDNFKIGYVAIDGTKALVGETGKVCAKGKTECDSNTDPAAIFSSGKPFSALWTESVSETNSSSDSSKYSLSPCREIGGKWYADVSF